MPPFWQPTAVKVWAHADERRDRAARRRRRGRCRGGRPRGGRDPALRAARGHRPAAPAGHRPLRVLHLSDLHLTPRQHRKREWVSSLVGLRPDLVVDTGDNLAHRDSLPAVLDALGGLLDVPGVFVLGSNDYYSPVLRNPLRYLLPDDGSRNTSSEQLRVARDEGRPSTRRAGSTSATRGRRSRWATRRSRSPASTTPTWSTTGSTTSPVSPTRPPTSGSASPTRRTCGCSTSSPATATTRCWPGHTHGGQVCLPGGRRPGHQLRPRAGPGQGPAPSPGRLAARRARVELAARVGRPRHLAVRPGPAVVPSRGDAAHPHRPRLSGLRRPPEPGPIRGARRRSGKVAAARAGNLPGAFGVWRSLVARFVRDEEAAGSNPVTPTTVSPSGTLRRMAEKDAHPDGSVAGAPVPRLRPQAPREGGDRAASRPPSRPAAPVRRRRPAPRADDPPAAEPVPDAVAAAGHHAATRTARARPTRPASSRASAARSGAGGAADRTARRGDHGRPGVGLAAAVRGGARDLHLRRRRLPAAARGPGRWPGCVGGSLLTAFGVSDGGSTSFLAMGLVAVVLMLVLVRPAVRLVDGDRRPGRRDGRLRARAPGHHGDGRARRARDAPLSGTLSGRRPAPRSAPC